MLLYAGHAALIRPAEAGEASDRVPAAHGEAAGLQLIIQGFLLLFAGHAALFLPAEAGEASDRVPAAFGEAAEVVIS